MLEALSLPFFQRAVVEVILLAAISGLLGTWIVLRGLAFFSHAVGAATVPGLVVADGLAFSALLGAFGAALLTAGAFALLSRRRAVGTDSATALVLAGALAAGVILASDVFGSQGSVDRLLFGSLLAIGSAELLFAAGVLAAAVVAARLFGPRWLGEGFAGPGPDRGPDVALALLQIVVVHLLLRRHGRAWPRATAFLLRGGPAVQRDERDEVVRGVQRKCRVEQLPCRHIVPQPGKGDPEAHAPVRVPEAQRARVRVQHRLHARAGGQPLAVPRPPAAAAVIEVLGLFEVVSFVNVLISLRS